MKKSFLISGLVLTLAIFGCSQIKSPAPKDENINSFEQCAAAGYPIMESYPRQCRTSSGRHFVEEIDEILVPPPEPPTPLPPSEPPPSPPFPNDCGSVAKCTEDGQGCPAGYECSGLPAYGCYPPGCPTPICLGSNVSIATPQGEINVRDLKVGMEVWSQDATGKRVSVPLLKTAKTPVPQTHRIIHVTLTDGRETWASAGHPTADGRTVDQLKAGDGLDGGIILKTEEISYWDDATYDLLPASETKTYWANGILLGTTL